ncbi:MAG: hypothetical protein AAF628_19335 [Planctomycetota bacterium]
MGVDGTTWIAHTPAISPPARIGAGRLAFSPADGRTIMLGGIDPTIFMPATDTWAWDGTNWSIVDAGLAPGITSPPAGDAFALCGDRARNRVVHFGGNDPFLTLSAEHWEWDGASWTQRFPANAPSARRGAVMTYDSARQVCVLFGGFDGTNVLDDTWEWDGVDWREVSTPNRVSPPRQSPAFTYDAARGRVVLRGGGTLVGGYSSSLHDMWEFDGSDWHQTFTATTPPDSDATQIAYHSGTQRVIGFGGREPASSTYNNNTWAYGGTGAFFETFGAGCDGAMGETTIQPVVSGSPVPAIGASLDFDLAPIPDGVALVAFGGRGSGALSLDPVGAIGCWLYPQPFPLILIPLPAPTGVVNARFSMPVSAVFTGAVFELQAVVPDASAPALFITSDAGRGVMQ